MEVNIHSVSEATFNLICLLSLKQMAELDFFVSVYWKSMIFILFFLILFFKFVEFFN